MPGEKLRGKIGFISDNLEKPYKLYYQSYLNKKNTCFIELGNNPIKHTIPNDFKIVSKPEVFEVNKEIELNEWDIHLTVSEAVYYEELNFIKPRKGNKFLEVKLNLKNKGSNNINITSYNQAKIKDENNFIYDLDSLTTNNLNNYKNIDGTLNPNTEKEISLSFQIPKNSKNLKFTFYIGNEKIFVNIP